MSVLNFIDPEKFAIGADPVNVPSTDIKDVIGDGLNYLARNRQIFAEEFGMSLEVDDRNTRYKSVTDGGDLFEDAARVMLSPEEFEGLDRNQQTGEIRHNEKTNLMVDNYIASLRQEQPQLYRSIKTSQELGKVVEQKAIDSLISSAKTGEGATGFANVVGNLIAGVGVNFVDPVAAVASSIGISASASVFKTALVEGGINVAFEVLSHPAISRWQKELGQEYGVGDLVENSAYGFLFGSAFAGSVRGISKAMGASKAYAMSRAQRAAEEIGDTELATAAATQQRKFHINESKSAEMPNEVHRQNTQQASHDLVERGEVIPENLNFDEASMREAPMPEATRQLQKEYLDETPIDPEVDPANRLGKPKTLGDTVIMPDRTPDARNIPDVAAIEKEISSPEALRAQETNFEEAVARRKMKGEDVLFDEVDAEGNRQRVTVDEYRALKEQNQAVDSAITRCSVGVSVA